MNEYNFNLKNDPYFQNDYVSLYAKEGELFIFTYEKNNYYFINKTLKRPIKQIGKKILNGKYFDLETAYGYGGFYTNTDDLNFINEALTAYQKKCLDENIIAEFIRFHPFNSFPIKHSDFFDFNHYDRDVVIVDLSNDILSSYKSKVRNIIKKAVSSIHIEESQNIDSFIDLYYETMKKNNADNFYFFDKNYFQNILKQPFTKLYEAKIDDFIVAMGIFMFGSDIAHYHLSANSQLSYKYNANYALLHYLFSIAQGKGLKYFLLGGGTTSDPNDPLFKFKKKFSNKTLPFYISGKIYNYEVYNNYNKLWQEQSDYDIKYFLKYRLKIK